MRTGYAKLLSILDFLNSNSSHVSPLPLDYILQFRVLTLSPVIMIRDFGNKRLC